METNVTDVVVDIDFPEVEILSPSQKEVTYGLKIMRLSGGFVQVMKTGFSQHVNKTDRKRKLDLLVNLLYRGYADSLDNMVTIKNLIQVHESDDYPMDVNIVNRISLLKKFHRSEFSNRDRYTGNDKIMFDEFKKLSPHKRNEVLDILSQLLYTTVSKLNDANPNDY